MKEPYDTMEGDGFYKPVFEKVKTETVYEIIVEEIGKNPEIFIKEELELIRFIAEYAGRTDSKVTITPLKMKENE